MILGPLFSAFNVIGFVGVDIFFVISGFIIWEITGRTSGLNGASFFLLKRLGRVYLGYWPWLLGQSIVISMVLPVDMLGAALRAKHDVLQSVLLLPSDNPILGLSWTLIDELMFYVVIGCSLAFSRAVALSVILIWGLTTLFTNTYSPPGGDLEVFTPFVIEFCMGVLLSEVYRRFGPFRIRYCLLYLLASSIITGIAVFKGYQLDGESLVRVLTIGPLSIGCLALALAMESAGWRAGTMLVGLGDASYSLYLCHVPLILASKVYLSQADISPDVKASVIVWAILLFSVGWFRLVEWPVYRTLCRVLASVAKKSTDADQMQENTATAAGGKAGSNAVDAIMTKVIEKLHMKGAGCVVANGRKCERVEKIIGH
jgi:exopolysaccharide production protein ExoZ